MAKRKQRSGTYWALSPSEHIASEINAKFESYLHWLNESGQASRIQVSYNLSHGEGHLGRGSNGVESDSDDGVVSRLTVPHYKNLLNRVHSLVCQAKLSFKPKAINSDSDSQMTANFAKGLLEYETDKGLSKITSRAVDYSLKLFDSYIYAPWNFHAGNKITASNGKPIYAGDQEYYVLNAFECARAYQQEETPYYIVQYKANRYDLAAIHPEKSAEILAAGNPDNSISLSTSYDSPEQTDDDMVTVRVLLHRPTPALPQGRETTIIDTTVLDDTTFKYKELPVVRMKAGEVLASTVADSPGSSLISIQEVLDRVYSANVTNVLNGALSNIYSSDPNIDIQSIGKGKNLIIASAPPQAISLTGSSPESYNLVNDLINQETLLSGINNTARGNPESNLKSGNSLALMLSTAIQFVSDIQLNYAQATADLATIIIHNLQDFCKEPRLARFAGVNGKELTKSFQGKDLEGVDRVSVELGNPVTQTVAGKMSMVEMMLQYGAIKDPRKIDDFLRTGNWEQLTENNFKESMLIKEENERLSRGEMPLVMVSDKHPEHINEHLTVLFGMDARNNPKIVAAVLQHVQLHLEQQKSMDPDLAAIIGIAPLPSQSMPPPGPSPSDDQTPEVMGQNMPNTPAGTPDQFAQPYADFQQQAANNPAATLNEG